MERTEEQKITQAEIKVILGGKEYSIKPLVIKDSRVWRGKVVKLVSQMLQFYSTKSDKPEEFGNALKALLVTNTDEVIGLFFDYARDLNQEEIEGKATEAEIAEAWQKIVEVSFPLAATPMSLMKPLR